jgi:hypothetical protein
MVTSAVVSQVDADTFERITTLAASQEIRSRNPSGNDHPLLIRHAAVSDPRLPCLFDVMFEGDECTRVGVGDMSREWCAADVLPKEFFRWW